MALCLTYYSEFHLILVTEIYWYVEELDVMRFKVLVNPLHAVTFGSIVILFDTAVNTGI